MQRGSRWKYKKGKCILKLIKWKHNKGRGEKGIKGTKEHIKTETYYINIRTKMNKVKKATKGNKKMKWEY